MRSFHCLRRVLLACVALAPTMALHAAVLPDAVLATASRGVIEDRYPPRQVAFADGVTGRPDVVYWQPSGFRPLTLDLYLPAAPKTGGPVLHPLVLFLHGGAWFVGHSRHSGAFENWPNVLAALAAHGYVVSSLNYRFSREAPFPAALQDVKVAIRFLREHAAQYGIDKERVLVWGGSSGGQLAALAATSCNVAALAPPDGVPAQSDCVQGAVLWYPYTDMGALPAPTGVTPSAEGRYLGCEMASCPAETLRLASPASQVTAATPPMLIIHGTLDKTVPVQQSLTLDAALRKAGVHSELLLLPGIGHQFVGDSADATHAASVQALDRSVQFIDATLGRR